MDAVKIALLFAAFFCPLIYYGWRFLHRDSSTTEGAIFWLAVGLGVYDLAFYYIAALISSDSELYHCVYGKIYWIRRYETCWVPRSIKLLPVYYVAANLANSVKDLVMRVMRVSPSAQDAAGLFLAVAIVLVFATANFFYFQTS